jgi:vacuolar-type H+-ATPase subunit C/Vma6
MTDLYYLNARLRAMRGRLLDRHAYDELLALPDLPSLTAHLLNGPYGRSIEAVGETGSESGKIEEGLRRDLSDTFIHLHSMSAGDPQEAVRLLMSYWEAHNLKTILRGLAARRPAEEIHSLLIPTGLLDEPALAELCRQPDLRAAVDLLITWRLPYGPALLSALKDYREPKDLFFLEMALDRFSIGQASRRFAETVLRRADRETLRALLCFLTDRTNLLTAFKAVEDRIVLMDRERYFLPGGEAIAAPAFGEILASRTLPEAIEKARRPPFDSALRDLGETEGGLSLLSVVERRLDTALLRRIRSMNRTEPLGIGGMILYLLDKVREITNLRMILRARWVGLPEPDLMRLLILEY